MDDKKKTLVVVGFAIVAIVIAIMVVTKTTASSSAPEPQNYAVQPPSDKQSGEMNKAAAGQPVTPGGANPE